MAGPMAASEQDGFDDAEAIALLEESVIPWHNGSQHGPEADDPRRRLREKPTANPLDAAEGLLGKSARAGPAGAGDQLAGGSGGRSGGADTGRTGPGWTDGGGGSPGAARGLLAAEFARQGRQILAWAKRHGRLIDRRLEDRLVSLGGVEHEVFLDDATGRWLKMTMPGKGGKELHAREEGGFGVRPTLTTEDALPAAYLHRLRLANRRLGDDFWLHGVIDHPAGPRLVVSQRDISGEPATPEEIARHFVTAGYWQVNAKTFFRPDRNLLVSDAHTANVFRTSVGVAPFDVCVQQPRGVLLRAVMPPVALSFDAEEEQGALRGF